MESILYVCSVTEFVFLIELRYRPYCSFSFPHRPSTVPTRSCLSIQHWLVQLAVDQQLAQVRRVHWQPRTVPCLQMTSIDIQTPSSTPSLLSMAHRQIRRLARISAS